MTAAETRQQRPPALSSSAPVASCATKASSALSASPDESTLASILRCSFGIRPDGGYTDPAPWQGRWAQLAWRLASIDWSRGTRIVISISNLSGRRGVTTPSISPGKVLGAQATHFEIDESHSLTPRQVAELVSRQRELVRGRELLDRYWPGRRFVDTALVADSPPPPRPLLELSLASPVFRSPTPSPAGAGTR